MHQFSDLIDFLPQSTILLLGISLITLTLTVFNFLSRLNCKFIYYGLFISVLLAGFGFALIDNFLHPWDEQFHALVAKNMISDPFHPVLINKIPSEFDYRIWVYNETWLHKQPLFLWQIAVSLKLFGTNLIALRLPSIIMYALTSCCVFSISKRFLNPFFAILAAAFFGYCGFALDFISGVQGMDHNDIAFLFYITASFWSWMKYNETKNFRYVMLIGLFSGGAVLCKWLTGLIVFTGWGIVTFAFNIKEKREWKNIFSAFGVCLLVFLPWQLYCFVNYPLEYKYEIAYNSAHFFSTVENHGGSSDFYFEGMKKIYGGGHLMRLFVLTGLLMTFVNAFRQKNSLKLFGSFVFLAVYLFFMCAATKLHGYVMIVSCFGFIFLLIPINTMFKFLKNKYNLKPLNVYFTVPLLLLLLILQFQAKGVIERHNFRSQETTQKWKNNLVRAEAVIRGSKNYNTFLIKNSDTPIVPAIRFITDKDVYEWSEDLENKETLVIDLENQDLGTGR